MPDFKRLRAEQSSPRSAYPRDIFNRLVKPAHMRDLLPGQIEVLDNWYKSRDQKDNILKQNTGGGKTLVGILIAQSTMIEKGGRVLYLCPNKQLVDQTIKSAAEVGIAAEPYIAGQKLSPRFLSGEAMMVASYAALFHGKSRFGVLRDPSYISVSALILDDAHVELASLRDAFTVCIRGDQEQTKDSYERLAAMLMPAFEATGFGMTFEAIIEGKEWAVLEVPYWKWVELIPQVAEVAKEIDSLAWPLIRDDLKNCHCLVGRRSISIVPILPPVDLLPTFHNASRRIFMSATLTDDSVLAATFGIAAEIVSRPIATASLASVGERMILIPGFRNDLQEDSVRKRATDVIQEVAERNLGAVILSPSKELADAWSGVARVLDTPEKVATAISEMQKGSDRRPIVLANRYDGIDLAGDSCRLLVMDGLPQGRSDYETYRASALIDSGEIASSMAQRVEQGLGRGSRGGGDYSAVVLLGDDLVEWISLSDNWNYMTTSTRAQIFIGEKTSEALDGVDDLIDSIWQCIDRNEDWIKYHQVTLADRVEIEQPPTRSDSPMLIERKAYEAARIGEFSKACNYMSAEADAKAMPRDYKAWFLQNAARYAWLADDRLTAIDLQKRAYSINRALFKPPIDEDPYVASAGPEFDQTSMMLRRIDLYHKPAAYLSRVQTLLRPLTVPNASFGQFEEALKDLGEVLGFDSERPDSGRKPRKGPDVLWLMPNLKAFVIEAKNEKGDAGHLHRDDHGQLLQSCVWFETHYPDWTYDAIVVLPEAKATKSVDVGTTRALDARSTKTLVDDTVAALAEIIALPKSPRRHVDARAMLEKRKLTPSLIGNRLVAFAEVADQRGQAISLGL